ncbi:MAG: hypothetical protein A2148_03375 [Chloroflexi bacterium RBG_16_68_14]|nr:MAG: hypothetical protein A2148_03375 [Chloroflexi bacterium RBG_16_68_14]
MRRLLRLPTERSERGRVYHTSFDACHRRVFAEGAFSLRTERGYEGVRWKRLRDEAAVTLRYGHRFVKAVRIQCGQYDEGVILGFLQKGRVDGDRRAGSLARVPDQKESSRA